jgi:hypothetical protein
VVEPVTPAGIRTTQVVLVEPPTSIEGTTVLSELADLRMTVRGGREEEDVHTISLPATRTIRMPAPGTLTSFTGTIRPGRRGCGDLTASPGPRLVTTVTGGLMVPVRVSVSRPGGPSEETCSLLARRSSAFMTAGSVEGGGLFSPFFKVIMLQSELLLLLLDELGT